MIKKIIKKLAPPLLKRFYKGLKRYKEYKYYPEWVILKGKLEGINFYLDPSTQLCKEFIKGHDAFYYPIIEDLNRKKSHLIIYDIGAHFGYHTLGFAKYIGENGIVISFEPNTQNILRLKKNIAGNPELANRIILKEYLISNTEGLEIFRMYKNIEEGPSSASGIIDVDEYTTILQDNDDSQDIKIYSTTIDSIIKKNEIQPPDIIKLDIEGAEYKALVGASSTIKKFKPTLLIEIHSIKNMFLIMNLLRDLNYNTKIVSEEKDGRCFIYSSI